MPVDPHGRKLHAGSVCIVNEVESIDNRKEIMPRTVLLMIDPESAGKQRWILAGVAISSKSEFGHVTISLPDEGEFPKTTTGLDRPSWAIPEWAVIFPLCTLHKVIGHVDPMHFFAVKSAVARTQSTRQKSTVRCQGDGRGNDCSICIDMAKK